jgi:transcriptional regulator with XRE-family HTH domain
LTQLEVSKRTGIPGPHISRYESGKGGNPSIPTLEKFARAYKCTVEDLIARDTSKPSDRVKDSGTAYTPDPEQEEILELLKNRPELKRLLLTYFKNMNNGELGEIIELVDIIRKAPREKRLSILNLLKS